jgi:hypothetical protein
MERSEGSSTELPAGAGGGGVYPWIGCVAEGTLTRSGGGLPRAACWIDLRRQGDHVLMTDF